MSDRERRISPRRMLAVEIALEVELHGFESGDDRFQACGQTVNLARGGALVTADRAIEVGVHCVVHFPQSMGLLGRTLVYGTVRRCTACEGGYAIAVVFDSPIPPVDLPSDIDAEL